MVKVNFDTKSTVDTKRLKISSKENIVQIGIVSGQQHNNGGGDLAEMAKELSFGTSKIPARPFLWDGIMKYKEKVNKEIGRAYDEILKDPKRKTAALSRLGAVGMGAVITFVRSDYYRETIPNAPMTIDLKGSDHPLIDTGQLVTSITYVVNGQKGGL